MVTCCTLSTQTLDGKLPSGHTWYKRPWPLATKSAQTMDGNYHPDIHNARGLDRLLQYQHRLWTETTILTYKIQEDLWPLATIQIAEFHLKLPTKVGATTWTLNTKGSTAKYSQQYIKKYPFSQMGATIWTYIQKRISQQNISHKVSQRTTYFQRWALPSAHIYTNR